MIDELENLEVRNPTDADTDIEVPEDPGPAAAGNTPIVGMVRRGLDMPVLRDELKDVDGPY